MNEDKLAGYVETNYTNINLYKPWLFPILTLTFNMVYRLWGKKRPYDEQGQAKNILHNFINTATTQLFKNGVIVNQVGQHVITFWCRGSGFSCLPFSYQTQTVRKQPHGHHFFFSHIYVINVT